MDYSHDMMRLTFYIGEEQKYGHTPLFEAITREARERGLGGVTVTRGVLGYGANSRVRTAQILRLSEDLPVVVELVEKEDVLRELAEHFKDAVGKGLVTLTPVEVLLYGGLD